MPLRAAELDPATVDLAATFQDVDVVLLGEHHDNPLHHALQARAVATLKPAALVFEMIEPSHARDITHNMRLDASALSTHLEWEARGWPDFAMYYPIFSAAPKASIFGGALPRDTVRKAIEDGAAKTFGASAPLFGLATPLPEAEQSDRELLQHIAHCDALPPEMLPGMVEAQRLRDAALARAVVNALAQGFDGPVVVIAGNGHVHESWGVPAALRRYADQTGQNLTIASLGQYEETAPETPPVTHWVVTKATNRGDPCAAFR